MKNQLDNAVIVDVRTPQEFAQGHYPGAVNIPLNEISERIGELKDMEKPIIAYCRSGNRSGLAVSIMKQNGIVEASNGGALEDLLQ